MLRYKAGVKKNNVMSLGQMQACDWSSVGLNISLPADSKCRPPCPDIFLNVVFLLGQKGEAEVLP